ncbi:MocR-like pyridoxine biosynthesis transcription factor PdxR [Brevibacillus fluminis]|uniref:MocR-like pyridoxine biosynthesis transcription factor PdxR n=1 Tax=Brevibacillus fluminis TaxID=511487 RepID=UPI003F88E99F
MLIVPVLEEDEDTPHYVQLYRFFKTEIATGRLSEQTRLPSVRKLADLLSLSTTPVETAYQQLMAEGFIGSRPRQGYFVQKLLEPYAQLGKGQPEAVTAPPLLPKGAYAYDFHLSKNDFSVFPFQTWRRLVNQTIQREQQDLLFYGDPQGESGLRQELARYLRQFRGVACVPDQIVIAADHYVLLSFLALLLKEEHARIGIENPSYPLLRTTFARHGLKMVPIPLEDDGISIQELYQKEVRVACVTPSHQYPRGMIMPISRRLQLLEWAKETAGLIIEDDYDGEFRYHGRPIPSLQGLVPDAPVVYLGGFGQVVAPAMCISYMVLPRFLLERYRQLYRQLLFEQSSSPVNQKAMQLFMEKGHFEKHVRKMRNVYRKKHDALIAAIQKHLGERVEIIGKDAGFHLLLRAKSPRTEADLLGSARQAGINLASAAYTWFGPDQEERKEFLIGFGGIDTDKIEPGIKLLREVWFD